MAPPVQLRNQCAGSLAVVSLLPPADRAAFQTTDAINYYSPTILRKYVAVPLQTRGERRHFD